MYIYIYVYIYVFFFTIYNGDKHINEGKNQNTTLLTFRAEGTLFFTYARINMHKSLLTHTRFVNCPNYEIG